MLSSRSSVKRKPKLAVLLAGPVVLSARLRRLLSVLLLRNALPLVSTWLLALVVVPAGESARLPRRLLVALLLLLLSVVPPSLPARSPLPCAEATCLLTCARVPVLPLLLLSVLLLLLPRSATFPVPCVRLALPSPPPARRPPAPAPTRPRSPSLPLASGFPDGSSSRVASKSHDDMKKFFGCLMKGRVI